MKHDSYIVTQECSSDDTHNRMLGAAITSNMSIEDQCEIEQLIINRAKETSCPSCSFHSRYNSDSLTPFFPLKQHEKSKWRLNIIGVFFLLGLLIFLSVKSYFNGVFDEFLNNQATDRFMNAFCLGLIALVSFDGRKTDNVTFWQKLVAVVTFLLAVVLFFVHPNISGP